MTTKGSGSGKGNGIGEGNGAAGSWERSLSQ
jgi:hypothetical protein